MMIVMKQAATEDEIRAVIDRIESAGARAHPSTGDEVTVIGAIGDLEHIARLELHGAPGVDRVVPILKPYKLASNQLKHGERTVLEIGGRRIGGEHFALIAGPCTVESRDQTLTTAEVVAATRMSARADRLDPLDDGLDLVLRRRLLHHDHHAECLSTAPERYE